MGEEVGSVVVVVAAAGKYANASAIAFGVVARVLECVMREFEEDALLGIDDLCFERTDAEEGCVEQIGAFDQSASADVVRFGAKRFVDARAQFLRREM